MSDRSARVADSVGKHRRDAQGVDRRAPHAQHAIAAAEVHP